MNYWIQNEQGGWLSYDNCQRPLLSLLERMLASKYGAGPAAQDGLWPCKTGEKEQSPDIFSHTQRALSVCAVGAGGKTSLIWALQREAVLQNRQVLVTTTTHMMLTRAMMENGIAAGVPIIPEIREGDWIKCSAPGAPCLEAFRQTKDVLLIEADGSRRFPMKVPASHEPVIPPWTRIILVVCGLSALGRPLEQTCHRHELLKLPPGRLVTPDLMADTMKTFYLKPLSRRFPEALILPVWNQADTSGMLEAAQKTAALCGWNFQLITRMDFDRSSNPFRESTVRRV